MSKTYRLYSSGRNGVQTLLFTTVGQRQRFLQKQRAAALKRKQQLRYKGTEYLRIYSNCVLYQEYDIKAQRSPEAIKTQAERFFNAKTSSPV